MNAEVIILQKALRLKNVYFKDLGLVDYQQTWDYQEQLFKETIDLKIRNRDLPEEEQTPTSSYLLFCEHPHVYTLGKSGDEKNLLVKPEDLPSIGATYYKINRGGDITYHGPGQIVGYPIFDLDNFFTDIHKYLRLLEEAIIQTLDHYGIKAGRVDGLTGVWIDGERKICAMGIRCSRWVTMHGFAFNINSNLGYFKNIIPCGIDDKEVTSMEQELGHSVDMAEIKALLREKLAVLFELHYV